MAPTSSAPRIDPQPKSLSPAPGFPLAGDRTALANLSCYRRPRESGDQIICSRRLIGSRENDRSLELDFYARAHFLGEQIVGSKFLGCHALRVSEAAERIQRAAILFEPVRKGIVAEISTPFARNRCSPWHGDT